MSVRTDRVGAMIRSALGTMFQREMPEFLDGMITVASVKMSPDLRIAKVYVSIFRSRTNPDILIKRLNAHQAELRHRLADEVEMRFLPELRFYRDDTLDTVERIDKILKDVRAEDEARQAERGERTPDDSDDLDGDRAGTTPAGGERDAAEDEE